MAIIIGAATTVSFMEACVTSANWSASPNNQRLYCLGGWDPHLTISKPTETLSLTIYAPGSSYSTAPTTSCANANTVAASISPTACGGSASGPTSSSWYVTSYSYSKEEASMPGTESWSLQQWIGTLQPSYIMRGITDGQATANAGVTFSSTDVVGSSTGSVSAGGFGRADELTTGVVSSVGGGSSTAGDTGQGSASISYTDLYL